MMLRRFLDKIERKRDSDKFVWQNLVSLKDSGWKFYEKLKKDYPKEATIEIVRGCNLQCPACPVGNKTAKEFPNMGFSMYKKIIDDISPFIKRLYLYNFGEPLLHSELGKFIRYAKKSGVRYIELASNGLLLTKEKSVELIESGLDNLRISIDAIDEETYSKYRVGGDFNKLIRNIRGFMKIRNKMKSQSPHVQLQFVVMSHNEGDIKGFKDLAIKFGADSVRYKTFNANLCGSSKIKKYKEFISKNPAYSRYEDKKEFKVINKRSINTCPVLQSKISINADGSVVICDYDFNNKYVLGHVSDGGFKKWWNTKKRKEFRKLFLNNFDEIELCKNCSCGTLFLDDINLE